MAIAGQLPWIEPVEIQVPDDLQAAVGGHPLLARILAGRGYLDPAQARAFLDPGYYSPAFPFDLPGMQAAVERLEAGIRAGQNMCVWGDFDVDGQTATTVLFSTLKELGARVTYHIPVRERESHGVNLPVLQQIIAGGAQLILTCDTGISAQEAVEYANDRGVDVIVTDHHDLPAQLPKALAVVNPKRLPEGHPAGTLPGVGVAYLLARALYERAGRPGAAEEHLDLVALGIVADLALLRGDARYLVQRGLERLRENRRLGLQQLLAFAEVDPGGLTEEHISYVIAPRLNALGRLADANPAVEFLTTQDPGQARLLATQLEGLNAQRQLLTEQVYQGALAQIERDPAISEASALVLSHPAWPAGVIGIVASRLVERFNRPALLISAPPGEIGRGSARSVEGLNITAAIAAQGEMLLNFGGHPMAAGLAIEGDRIEAFRYAFNRTVRKLLGTASLAPALIIDAELPLAELSIDLVADLERLAPFGPGNPPLTLACRDVVLKSQAIFGRRQEHLQLIVEDESGRAFKVLWWNGSGEALPEPIEGGAPFVLAYAVRASNYRGFRELQIEWTGARPSEKAALQAGWLRPPAAVEDYRGVEEPLTSLRSILAQGEVMVWAEGAARQQLAEAGIAAQNRAGLAPAQALAIWSTPPGPGALQAALERVAPKTVYLFAADPQADDLQLFLGRLGGLVKHVLRADQGRARLSELAAATAQREATVRVGLAWLEAAGHVMVQAEVGDEIGDEIVVKKSEPARPGNLEPVAAQLGELLAETAAYRAYFRRADLEALLNARPAQNLNETG